MHAPARDFQQNDPALLTVDRRDWIAVLPLGAHEQHGPHLPFDTDSLIVEGIAARLKKDLPAALPVTFLPVEPVGYSVEHMHVAGTRTLSYVQAVERWLAIAGDLAAVGIRKFVMLNAHGGNSPLMTIVAVEARVRFNMLAVATGWLRFGTPEGLLAPEDKALDIHAGDIETSVMLALHPESVAMEQARTFSSRQAEFARRFKHLRAYGPHAFGWKMSDLNPEGAAGNALQATGEKGEALIAHSVAGLTALFEDIAAFDEDWLGATADRFTM